MNNIFDAYEQQNMGQPEMFLRGMFSSPHRGLFPKIMDAIDYPEKMKRQQAQMAAYQQFLQTQSPELQQLAQAFPDAMGEQFVANAIPKPGKMPEAYQIWQLAVQSGETRPFMQWYEEVYKKSAQTNVNVNTTGDQRDEFLKQVEKNSAQAYTESLKEARSAIVQNEQMDRIIANSAEAPEGGAGPYVQMIGSWLVSMGVDEKWITSGEFMTQASNQMLADYMQALGARGLTDSDMKVLKQALPNIGQSHTARTQVANVMKRRNYRTIRDARERIKHVESTYPEYKGFVSKSLRDWKDPEPYGQVPPPPPGYEIVP